MRKARLTIFAVILLLALGLSRQVQGNESEEEAKFVTLFPKNLGDKDSCGGRDFDEAQATLAIDQVDGMTEIEITVAAAAPDTLYTVWIRFAGGRSPLTGKSSSPLANPSDIADLASVTPDGALTMTAKVDLGLMGDDGTGSTDVVNGFFTDHKGEGQLKLDLDFPLIKGAFPFQDIDPSLAPNLDPVPLQTPNTNNDRILSIVSHCTALGALGNGHGLVASTPSDPDQAWFDLVTNPFEKKH